MEAWSSVFRFALAWTNDWSAAEDIAQDAFARLWLSRSRLDWSRPVLPWLLTTTRRLAIDRHRHMRAVTAVAAGSSAGDEDSLQRWIDVQQAFRRLTPLERGAVFVALVAGLDAAEGARVLGTSPGGLRSAVSRAREKLRKFDG